MDYSKMSDQEINMIVAGILHPDSVVIESKSRLPCACITGHLPGLWVDYCNNPADAWPIIHKQGISIAFDKDEDEWLAWGDFAFDQAGWDMKKEPENACAHINPLRAAMIVFLMMQDSANVSANPAGPDIR
jgi:hypothetical protein